MTAQIRSLWASFFCIALCFICDSQAEHLTNDTIKTAQFSALLHVDGQNLSISDPTFYFSSKPSDINQEIAANLAKMTSSDSSQEYICRFPARAQWLANNYLEASPPDFSKCHLLQTFLNAVSAEKISLVYASENLVSPSSFMGHSFLKLNSSSSQTAGHAVSFFTDVDGVNLPKIMFESLVTGKESYFIVSPYKESLAYYKDIEGRNIYEYQLDIDNKERELIQLHLWELKETQIDYFFHNQNCASITLNLIALVKPDLMQHRREWLSPLDLIQIVNDNKLIKKASITPSIGWKLRTYGAQLSNKDKQAALKSLIAENLNFDYITREQNREQKFLIWNFYKALNQHLLEEKKILESTFSNNKNRLNHLGKKFDELEIDLSKFKDPLKRSKDAQWQLGLRWQGSHDPSLTMTWLPASHSLLDDNRNAFSESSLELLKFSLSLTDSALSLDNLTLYSIKSYLPHDKIFGGLSGKFSIQWDRGTDFYNTENKRLYTSGGLGLSKKLNHSIQTYATLDTEISIDNGDLWGTFAIEAGMFSYLKHNIKANLSTKSIWNLYQKDNFTNSVSLDITYLGLKNTAFDFKGKFVESDAQSEAQFELLYRHYY